MRRTSVIGPLILILLGVLLLIGNLSAEFSFLDVLAVQWPWILVAWGVIRLGELFVWSQRPEPLFPQGLRSGEWFLVVLICLAGSALYGGRNFSGNFPFQVNGLRMFGEPHDFSIEEQRVPVNAATRILVENLRGEVIFSGEDIEDVRVTGRESVRALSDEDANKTWSGRKLTIEQQGDLVIVRTNQEGVASDRRLASYLQIRLPKKMQIETRGRDTTYEVNHMDGNMLLAGDEGDARVNGASGEVRIKLNKSDKIQVRDAKGLVEISSSRGDDVDLENIGGPVTIIGSFGGNMVLRGLAKPVRIEDRRLDLRAEAIPGEAVADRGHFQGKGITGPIRISSDSKDIELERFTGPLELTLERGDAEIRNEEKTVSPMTIDVRRGKVLLAIRETDAFAIDGEARKGEVENRTSLSFRVDSSGSGSRIQGGKEGAPKITIRAERLEIEALEAAKPEEN
ncbi:MAG: DUF4097 family beta strand repeat-containing protein [Bryobacterales bacterium]|nr:DUF4097 family beta strand repeat-containing protein [Bryobacterales bacterium]